MSKTNSETANGAPAVRSDAAASYAALTDTQVRILRLLVERTGYVHVKNTRQSAARALVRRGLATQSQQPVFGPDRPPPLACMATLTCEVFAATDKGRAMLNAAGGA